MSIGVCLTLLAGTVAADDYVGGLPLKTVQTGTVTGGLYISGNPPSSSFTNVVDRTFTLPAAAVADSGRVKWARLYVSSYAGHMQNAYNIKYTTKVDWNNDGTWDNTWTETDIPPHAFQFAVDGGNDNSGFAGHSTGEPYLMLNDHTTRVTSDYLSWYNVTNLIQPGDSTIKVNVNATGSYDGRIKVVELVVAYDDPASTTLTQYWVNEGHDACTYYTEDSEDAVAVGTTTFNTSGLSNINSATLIADYMASNNGYYGFPTSDNDFVASAKTGSFTNIGLDRIPDAQGVYSGIDSWNVTSSVSNNNSVTFAYARYLPGTGNAAFFKIPLAFLVVKKPLQSTPAPVADFTANRTSGTAPLSVQFTDNSTGTVSSYAWDFNNDGVVDSTAQNPSYTYSTAGIYTVNLTVTGPGGSDSEKKTNYITVTAAPTNNLTIAGAINPQGSTVFAKETNTVSITNVKNTGSATLTNISVALYASDVSGGNIPVNTTTIASLAGGAQTTVTLIDPTIRNLEGTITYRAYVDPNNLISETNEGDNNKTASKPVKYNGYKGKGLYWEGGSNITTKHTFDLKGNLLSFTQPESAYRGVGWTDRTENWAASDISIPTGSTIEKVFLYFPYNWDHTDGGYAWLNLNFNGNILLNGNISTVNGALYTDKSNFGGYANYLYGLIVFDVTDKFSSSGNTLVSTPITPPSGSDQIALYPSTLVVIYRNSNETRKQIFINEECDELGLSESGYGTTSDEATAYAPFTNMSIDKNNVTNATLYSFAGSAGPDEGNLLFNGNIVATNAWQGSSDTASPLVFNVTNYISAIKNVFGIQSTSSGGMDALQQILVVEYPKETVPAPVANFTAAPISGNAPLTVQFTDASTGSVSSYAWDFNNDGVVDSTAQNPSYTYNAPGTYTVNLTVTGPGGSNSTVKTGYIVINESPKPDLIVTAITPNAGEIFANETNTISATVKNVGAAAAGNSTVKFTVNGLDTSVPSGGLAVGANTTLTITDSALRSLGDSVAITVTADSNNEVSESNETNNSMTLTKTVVNNGYKSKRYTGGSDITTKATFEGKYGLVYSVGNAAYNSANWTAKTYTWSSTDLPIPTGATVVSARLYQAYNYNKMASDPAFTMSFNSNTLTPITTYKDRKSYGQYDYPYGLYVYNVTSLFNPSGNSITITPEAGNNYAIWGAYMVVVYQDPAGKTQKIWINDEFDILAAGASYAVNSDEATAYAPFNGVNASGVSKATSIAILAAAADSGKSKFYFNNQEYPGFWTDYLTTPQIGFSSYNVTGAIQDGTDTARLQSYLNGTAGDSMYAMNTILMVEYPVNAPVANFSGAPTSGTMPLTVQFTDASTGTVSSYAWDFNNDGVVDSTAQNPSYTYNAPGTYTVNLTVAGPGGSDSEVKTGYIVVSTPANSALSITKTANVTSYNAAGQIINYIYNVTNTGNVAISAPISVTDNRTGIVQILTTGSLTVGEMVSGTANYVVQQSDLTYGSITNSAYATAGSTVSNTANVTVTKAAAPQGPALTITKTANPTTYTTVGQKITYNYTITNSGDVPVSSIKVTDNKTKVTISSATLAPGASVTGTGTYSIKQDDLTAGSVTNSAYATGTFNKTKVTSNTVTARVTATQSTALTITKTASPTTFKKIGQVIKYTYTVTNSGNVPLSSIAVTDSKTTVVIKGDTLAPGKSVKGTGTYTITQADITAGSLTNTATATGTFDGKTVTSNTVTATVTAVQIKALKITKPVANPTTYNTVGQTITYTHTVTNSGNVPLSSIAVNDNKANVVINVGALAPGSSVTVTGTYIITQADITAGSLTNTATATGTFDGKTVTSNTVTATVKAKQSLALTITKTANPTNFNTVGQMITYTYIVTNSGNVPVSGIAVTDNKVTPVTISSATLAPGSSVTGTGTYIITSADIKKGSVTNTVTATGTFNGKKISKSIKVTINKS